MAFASLTAGLSFSKKNNASIENILFPKKSLLEAAATVKPAIISSDDVSSLRKKFKIKATALNAADFTIPDPVQSFGDLLSSNEECETALENLLKMQFFHPTAVQMQVIPLIQSHQCDLLCCSPTGSGKTMAFLLPLLLKHVHTTVEEKPKLTALIIEPVRELARQVYDQATSLAKGTSWQIHLLGEKDHEEIGVEETSLIITTPLKLIHALKRKKISIEHVETLVFDEADKLFEDDFLEQTDAILSACSSPLLRKAMFSATIPSGVEELAKAVMSFDTVRVIVGHKEGASTQIDQQLLFCGTEEGKLSTLKQLFVNGQTIEPPCLLFVQSIDRSKQLYDQLKDFQHLKDIGVDVVHSGKSKIERDISIDNFREAKTMLLITTDALARGIDFKGVNTIVIYDFPQSSTSYIHRIGRTGRHNRRGKAITLFTNDDAPYLKSIVNVMRNSGLEVPEWMLQLKNPSKNEKKQLKKRPVERKDVKDSNGYAERPQKRSKRQEGGAGRKKSNAGIAKNKAKKKAISLKEA